MEKLKSGGITSYKWILITGTDRKTIDENGIMSEKAEESNWFHGDKENMMEEARKRAKAYRKNGHSDITKFYTCDIDTYRIMAAFTEPPPLLKDTSQG